MMLEYEWANPAAAAAAAAMMLFGEGGVDGGQEIPGVFEHFDGHGLAVAGEFFEPPAQHLNAAALFSTVPAAPVNAAACGQRYGLGLPPPHAPAAPARIGLNLGVRTYFSSASPEEEMGRGRVCRRRTRTARCQAEGCGVDLTHAKHYHRRHKVCEFHSKASIVIAAGLSQRFCQQCNFMYFLSSIKGSVAAGSASPTTIAGEGSLKT
ncbi:Squamosa promoter-binding-like protein 8 [Apostasia shenzhenica]|uniref:Squamosa promoter-binding-like protein 8 n=1 Tax=Apostasia shenzhenica TaxID=1088818 RepID=A0A2H9ZT37_9ASPA|nr:Squamosa promoter-binding-like protein 8 [Apostasia shenzhenica]